MSLKYWLILPFQLCFLLLHAQEIATPKWRVSPNIQLMVGGALNATYDGLLGGEIQYYFPVQKKYKPFISAAIHKDFGISEGAIYLFSLGTGIQLDLSPQRNSKGFYLGFGLGVLHHREKLSIHLTDRTFLHPITNFGIHGQVSLDYQLTKNIGLGVQVKQFHLQGTSIGLSSTFSF